MFALSCACNFSSFPDVCFPLTLNPYVAEADLGLLMFLLLSYKFEDYSWGYECTSPHLVYGVLWLELGTSCLLGKRQHLQPHCPYKMG